MAVRFSDVRLALHQDRPFDSTYRSSGVLHLVKVESHMAIWDQSRVNSHSTHRNLMISQKLVIGVLRLPLRLPWQGFPVHLIRGRLNPFSSRQWSPKTTRVVTTIRM